MVEIDHVDVFMSKDGWRFHAVGGNNQPLDQSEAYERLEKAVKTATAIAGGKPVYVTREDGTRERWLFDSDGIGIGGPQV